MIVSPIPYGSGAFVVHSMLAKYLNNYKLVTCSPKRSYFPPLYYPLGRNLPAKAIHAVPESAIFHQRHALPLILTIHGYAIDKALYAYSSLLQNIHGRTDLRWLYRASINNADTITTVSQFTANLVQQDLQIKKSIKVIYNGVDEKLFTPKKRIVGKEIKVLFSGNLTKRKGAHLLLPIVQRLNKNIIIYYTSGLRETSKLVDHARLRPLGRVPHDKMPDIYRDMDILLFPTVREGFGLAALEAMACGLPIVATNSSALPELITHKEGGFLCSLGDVDTFAESIQILADNFNLRHQCGEFNREIVLEKFTINKMIGEYFNLFSSYI
jgi:glycosyltransferase involved in cell wall biosynthesis